MNKRKPGRPKSAVTYSKMLTIPLTPDQKLLVDKFAASRGYTGGTAPYFRDLILNVILDTISIEKEMLEQSTFNVVIPDEGGGNEKT